MPVEPPPYGVVNARERTGLMAAGLGSERPWAGFEADQARYQQPRSRIEPAAAATGVALPPCCCAPATMAGPEPAPTWPTW